MSRVQATKEAHEEIFIAWARLKCCDTFVELDGSKGMLQAMLHANV